MRFKSTFIYTLLMAAIVATLITGKAAQAASIPPHEHVLSARSVLEAMQRRWNRGDLDGFMNHYWKNDAFRFVSGATSLAGWDETLHWYKNHYPSPEEMGWVTFSNIRPVSIEKDQIVLLANWHLQFKVNAAEGLATFVITNIGGDWVVTFEHASR